MTKSTLLTSNPKRFRTDQNIKKQFFANYTSINYTYGIFYQWQPYTKTCGMWQIRLGLIKLTSLIRLGIQKHQNIMKYKFSCKNFLRCLEATFCDAVLVGTGQILGSKFFEKVYFKNCTFFINSIIQNNPYQVMRVL